ncbi:AMP-binding protein [Microcella alkalica]|uniref:AMP-binding protein n=1 Tax=Microcella alkalica TaxID=355930 RepID=UPI00145C47E1|nr:AMP-binding protein [Microcella alkalica]
MTAPSTTTLARARELPLLAGADDDVALVGPHGRVTYGELRDRVAERSALLGAERRLVMLACRRDEQTIVSLLAALAGGHPVVLVDAGEGPAATLRRSILDAYDPDTVLDSLDGELVLEHSRDGSAHELHPELAMLLSTSGSTGSPKLVRLSRENLRSNARAIAEYLRLTREDRGATTLPLHYCYGLSIVTSHLAAGASVLLTERSVVDPAFWSDAREARVTSLAGVPHTFSLLEASEARPFALPSLRLMTQAGGRLAADRVRRWAGEAAEHGADFVVMYGATEATARMAYLPPHLAASRPEAIGVAIPGGALRIDAPDEAGCGELVYTGPNVMMGYAASTADLARGAKLDELRTGDLARIAPDGLVEIVGRASRFVKLFGLRVDLDRLETLLGEKGLPAYAVEGPDGVLVGSPATAAELECVPAVLAAATGLPTRSFAVARLGALAVTSSGKPDRGELRELAERLAAATAQLPAGEESAVSSARAADDDPAALTEAVRALYATVLDRPDAAATDSFVTLDGDSLAYVEAVVRLERLVGALPREWPTMTAAELGALAAARAEAGLAAAASTGDGERASTATATAASAASRRRSSWALVTVEAPVALRALAIVLIVGTHANLLGIQGGAHVLLAVLGYNLARFPLAGATRAARVRGLVRATAMIAVPAVLWIGGVALTTGAYEPTTALLLNSVLGDASGWSEQWRFWFLEAAVWATLLGALALLVPGVDRLERRAPFALAVGVVVAALGVRLAVTGGVTSGAVERYALPGVLWLLALGWAIARAETVGQRAAVSGLALIGTIGFFGDVQREAVVVAGLLALTWLRSVRIPRLVVPVVTTVATASLFVYLVHWELYPLLEDDAPLAATLVSFAAGIAVHALWRAASISCRRAGRRGRRASSDPR